MSRSGKLLTLGFVLVLAGVVALWRFATTGDATANVARPMEPTASPESPAPPPTAPAAPAATPSKAVGPLIPSRAKNEPALVDRTKLATGDEEVEYAEDGKAIPVAGIAVLRKAAVPTDNMIRQCIIDSGVKGLTGKAILTHIVSRKKDKNGEWVVQVEDSGFEEEGTTIKNPALIECMHKTAFRMTFPPSKSPVAVWARRRINVDNNELDENLVFEWGRIR